MQDSGILVNFYFDFCWEDSISQKAVLIILYTTCWTASKDGEPSEEMIAGIEAGIVPLTR